MGIDFSKVDWEKKLVAAGIDRNCLTLNKAGPCPLCFDGKRGGKRFRFDNKGVNRENGKNRALALADKRQGSATQYLPVLSCPFRKKT